MEKNTMTWGRIEGQWSLVSPQAKTYWGKFSESDLTGIGGNRDKLVGKVQERYHVDKSDAEAQVNAWFTKLSPIEGANSGRGMTADGGTHGMANQPKAAPMGASAQDKHAKPADAGKHANASKGAGGKPMVAGK